VCLRQISDPAARCLEKGAAWAAGSTDYIEDMRSDPTGRPPEFQNPLKKTVTPFAAVWILGTFALIMSAGIAGAFMLTGGHRLLGIALVLSPWPIFMASGALASRRLQRGHPARSAPRPGRIERAVRIWHFLLPFGVLVLVGIALARM
jgi:hypothetical protein